MKLSISTDALAAYKDEGLDDRGVIKEIAGTGFKCVDYDLTRANFENPERDGQRLKMYFEEFGVTGGQAHAPGIDFSNIKNRAKWSDAARCLVFCKWAGIKQIVIHPSACPGNSREEFFDNNVAFYKSLIPYIEETCVEVLIENIGNYADPYYLFNGCALREMVDRVDHPMVFACWDTGHANHFLKQDNEQYPSIRALGDKLHAIHFQDNVGDISDTRQHHRIDMHLLPYMTWAGTLNYDAVLKGLVDIGYKGTFSFEPSGLQVRRYIDPFMLEGKEINALRLPPLKIWNVVYSALYEIGKYMLETYGVYEE